MTEGHGVSGDMSLAGEVLRDSDRFLSSQLRLAAGPR